MPIGPTTTAMPSPVTKQLTREQVLDEAVRRSMKPISMKQVVRRAENTICIRLNCFPHEWTLTDPGPENGAALAWWEGTIAEMGLSIFPGCVRKIRTKFNKMCRQYQL